MVNFGWELELDIRVASLGSDHIDSVKTRGATVARPQRAGLIPPPSPAMPPVSRWKCQRRQEEKSIGS